LSGLYNAYIEESIPQIIQREQGEIVLCQDGGEIYEDYEDESLTWEYGDVCMIVRIGKASRRATGWRIQQSRR
jgi:hypothetical protein